MGNIRKKKYIFRKSIDKLALKQLKECSKTIDYAIWQEYNWIIMVYGKTLIKSSHLKNLRLLGIVNHCLV